MKRLVVVLSVVTFAVLPGGCEDESAVVEVPAVEEPGERMEASALQNACALLTPTLVREIFDIPMDVRIEGGPTREPDDGARCLAVWDTPEARAIRARRSARSHERFRRAMEGLPEEEEEEDDERVSNRVALRLGSGTGLDEADGAIEAVEGLADGARFQGAPGRLEILNGDSVLIVEVDMDREPNEKLELAKRVWARFLLTTPNTEAWSHARLDACALLSEDALRSTFAVPTETAITLSPSCLASKNPCIRNWAKPNAEEIQQANARRGELARQTSDEAAVQAALTAPRDDNFANVTWLGFESDELARAFFDGEEEGREAGVVAVPGLGDAARWEPSREAVSVLDGDQILRVRVEIENDEVRDQVHERSLATTLLAARSGL